MVEQIQYLQLQELALVMALVVQEVGGRQVIRTQVHLRLQVLPQQILVAAEGDIRLILLAAMAALAALVA
jgi:hypothetical protein